VGQAWAGVVEDAEEELKKMGRGQERLVVTGAGRSEQGYPIPNASSRSQKSRSASDRARAGKRGVRNSDGDSGAASGSVVGDSDQSDSLMPNGRTKVDSREKKKGRLVSLGVVLLLALLIFLATAASRRLGSAE
jgi:hypothetical protein